MRKLIKKMLSMLMCTIMLSAMIPSEAFAEVVAYDVWIGKHQVTSANKDNIPVTGGSASYDPVNRILRFNNVTGIDGYHQGNLYNENPKYLIYFAVENLSIQGNLTLDVDDTSIGAVIYGQWTFDMNGDISITTNGATPVSGYRSIRSGGNIDLKNNSNDTGCAISASFEINIYNGKLNCVSKAEYYPARCIFAEDIIISSGEVYAECVGKPALDIDKKLVMDGGKITAYTTKSAYAIDGDEKFLTNKMTMRGGELLATTGGSTAIFFDDGITLDDTVEICDPPSGKLSSDNTTIVDTIGNKAKTVHIRKKGEYCNVVFSMNGGRSSRIIPAQSLLKGEKAERPMDPAWETMLNAKDFGGWYKESECINEFDFNEPIMKDTVIYAKWNPRYRVEFMMNGHGGYRPSDQTVKSGEKAVEPETPSDELYTFRGWYSDKELTKEFSFDTPIIKDTTLYAKWDLSKDFSKVKIVVNGEYVYSDRYKTEHKPAAEDITVTYGNTVLTPGTDYVITGYMNNVYPGKASVIIEGRGSCLGTAVGEFEIKKSRISLTGTMDLEGNTTGARLEDIIIKQDNNHVRDEDNQPISGSWIWDEPDTTISVVNGNKYKAKFVPFENADCFEDLTIDKEVELVKGKYYTGGWHIGESTQQLSDAIYEYDISDYIPDGAEVVVSSPATSDVDQFPYEFVKNAYVEDNTLKFQYDKNYAGNDKDVAVSIKVKESEVTLEYTVVVTLKRTTLTPQNDIVITPKNLAIEYGDNSQKVTATGGHTPIAYHVSGTNISVDSENGTITTNALGTGAVYADCPADATYAAGYVKTHVRVVRANINNKDRAVFSLSQDEYQYTGDTYKPDVTVTFNGEVLSNGTDYYLAYYNCTNAGTATVKVIGKGRFKGYKDLTYTIKPIEAKIKNIELHDRLYYPGVKGVGIKSVSFNDADGEDFYLSSVSYNIVAEMADDTAGDDKDVNIIVTMLDTNFAVDTSTANAKVTIHKNFLDSEEIKETATIGSTKQYDFKAKIPAGAKAVLYDYNDIGIFDAVPVVKDGILEVSVADDAESVDKEYFHAVAVRICDIPNYNDTYIYYTITMNDKAAAPEEEEQDEEQKEKVTTVSENILDPIKLEKVPEGVRLVSGKGGTIKLTVSANGVKVKKWVSSDKKIATVSKKGIVKAKKSGSVIITAHLKDGTKQEFNVLVEVPVIEKKINIVSFNQANLTISDNKIKFNITRFLDKETNKYSEWTGFTSSSKKTCTIDENGVVTILKNGKSTITIKYGKVKVKATVYIKFPDIKNKTVSLAKAGKSKKIALLNCKDKTKVYTLESSDPKVFTVDNEKRKVTAVAKGEAELILKVDGVEYDRCKVKVKK